MTIKLYNTKTRKKESFKPITKGLIKIYVCGVTVYTDVHIGHGMSYVYYDILLNYLKYFHNYEILYVRNITDVGHMVGDTESGEDKIEKRAKDRNVHPMELVYKYSHKMWQNFDKLMIDRPNIEPYASAHIIEMQEWIKKLLETGFAYEVDGNIYYDISKFKDYGKFANLKIDEMKKDSRFENDPNKRNSADFALWKKAEPKHILQWPSPWGNGYPGWHLECSVMGTKYLGNHFDIHGGGIENVFPHHQNEIAQNYGYFQKDIVNYWVHTAMLMVDGKKMGKSLGNYITIERFLKKHSPLAFRYLVSAGHYRKPLNYTEQSIIDAENTIERLNNYVKRLIQVKNNESTTVAKITIETTKENFTTAMNDDLNTSNAWATIFNMIRDTNKMMDDNKLTRIEADEILAFLKTVNLVFKVINFQELSLDKKSKAEISEEDIKKEIERRNKYRKEKQWEAADNIRLKLLEKGIALYDNKDGTTWGFA